jgi:hypothetical protein
MEARASPSTASRLEIVEVDGPGIDPEPVNLR